MARTFEEWEKPLKDLEEGIEKLKVLAGRERDDGKRTEANVRIGELEIRRDKYVDAMYCQLSPWDTVLVARAQARPYSLDYAAAIFDGFVELQGDRNYGADFAIVGGPAKFNDQSIMFVGHQKGRSIQERQLRNFGYARPEGYRKAIRLFEMAERFRLPVVTFIDTPGADAGVEAEKRGISEAIAASMMKMFELTVPIISVIIGEGGSGGAIGIGAANKVLMLEHSIYSVIAPEGCAAILWRRPELAAQAAAALRLTPQSALELGLIDGIIPEPKGGAHRDIPLAAQNLKFAIEHAMADLSKCSPIDLRDSRYQRFRKMGF